MTVIQRGFEWYSGGTIPAGRTYFTNDPQQLPQPLYTDPSIPFQWIGYQFPAWVPRQFALTYCRMIFEPFPGSGSDPDPYSWQNMSDAARLIELDIWIDAGAKSYLGGNPPGSESGGNLYQRVTTPFHAWAMPGDGRFYSETQIPLVPFYIDRENNDHLNIGFGNSYDLAWALMEIGIQTDNTVVWPGY